MDAVFLLLDMLTAFVLGLVAAEAARRHLRSQKAKSYHKDAKDLMQSEEDVAIMSKYTQVHEIFML